VVNAIGYDKWKATGQAEIFGDIDPPACFADLFGVFIDIFYLCPDGVRYSDILAYSQATQRQLSIHEVSLIRRMSAWAYGEINKALKESH
jgi:hypothetical protein